MHPNMPERDSPVSDFVATAEAIWVTIAVMTEDIEGCSFSL